MAKFKLYDEVQWESSAGGGTKLKTGIVMAIVPKGTEPKEEINNLMKDGIYKSAYGGGWPRAEESYIVAVPGTTSRQKTTLYWPKTKNLYPFTLKKQSV